MLFVCLPVFFCITAYFFSYFVFLLFCICAWFCVFVCLGLCLRRHTLAWLVGEAVRQRRTIQLRLSSFFPHLVIIQLFLLHNSQTLYIHAEGFFFAAIGSLSFLMERQKCASKSFRVPSRSVWSSLRGFLRHWSSSCLGNFEPCLHPQCAVVLNVCSHNGPQCPLFFLCGSFLCKPPQPSIHWHSTTPRPRKALAL